MNKRYTEIASDYGALMVHISSYLYAAATSTKKILGFPDTAIAVYNKNGNLIYCENNNELLKAGRAIQPLLERKTFVEEVYQKTKESSAALLHYTNAYLRKGNLTTVSDVGLVAHYKKVFELWNDLNAWGHLPNLADFGHALLSKRILTFLKSVSKGSTNTLYSILAAPIERSSIAEYDIAFYSTLAHVQSRKKYRTIIMMGDKTKRELAVLRNSHLKKIIDPLVQRYDWMQYHYDGPTILSRNYFLDLLESELKQGTRGDRKVRQIEREHVANRKLQKKLESQLPLDSLQKQLLHTARVFGYLKALRKDTVFNAGRNCDSMYREIARRMKITPLQARYLTIAEVAQSLRRGACNETMINRRMESFVLYTVPRGTRLVSGAAAKKLIRHFVFVKADTSIRKITGVTAYPGKVRGKVKIIAKADDMQKMNESDILMAPATNPNVVPAMKIAAAIVTDEGGVTCHAAIISRELKKPCVIGTKIATKVFKDDDLVEVDARCGVVRKLDDRAPRGVGRRRTTKGVVKKL